MLFIRGLKKNKKKKNATNKQGIWFSCTLAMCFWVFVMMTKCDPKRERERGHSFIQWLSITSHVLRPSLPPGFRCFQTGSQLRSSPPHGTVVCYLNKAKSDCTGPLEPAFVTTLAKVVCTCVQSCMMICLLIQLWFALRRVGRIYSTSISFIKYEIDGYSCCISFIVIAFTLHLVDRPYFNIWEIPLVKLMRVFAFWVSEGGGPAVFNVEYSITDNPPVSPQRTPSCLIACSVSPSETPSSWKTH